MSAVVGWQAEPSTRGTFTLLSSCFSTLLLCVLTALHLDVPASGDGFVRTTWRKVKWIIAGLVAPDVLTYVAWKQRSTAGALCVKARTYLRKGQKLKVQPTEGGTSPRPRQHTWTRVHGFYASSGGFALCDNNGPDRAFLPDSRQHVVLTAEGVEYLMKHAPDLIPDLSVDEILDKSKANAFAKCITFIQVVWFCLQWATRAAQHLPISLIETNTLGHGLCTIVTFLLWWSKPLDVSVSTVIYVGNDERSSGLLAYMWMASESTSQDPDRLRGRDCEFASITLARRTWASPTLAYPPPTRHAHHGGTIPTASSDPTSQNSPTEHSTSPPTDFPQRHHGTPLQQINHESYPSSPFLITPGKVLPQTNFTLDKYAARFSRSDTPRNLTERYKPRAIPVNNVRVELDSVDIRRWILASRIMGTFGLSLPKRDLKLVATSSSMPDVTQMLEFPDPGDLWRLWGFSLMGVVYGAIHATAWYASFPSHVEKTCWHISTLIVISYAVIVALRGTAHAKVREGGWLDKLLAPLSTFILVFGTILYLIARIFLIGESWRQVGELPQDVYELPSWTNYIPHFA